MSIQRGFSVSFVMFPSPRGDKLCQVSTRNSTSAARFPSPRGDKLCPALIASSAPANSWFPSPRGDKLCLQPAGSCQEEEGFRPLAGISCVQHCGGCLIDFSMRFPSPRGDKLCPAAKIGFPGAQVFPSPRGDKLCPVCLLAVCRSACFRPLAGISCVCKTAQLEPVGLGLVLTGSLYHTPLQPASGSWK